MRSAGRWVGCLALMAGGPYGLASLLVWLAHDYPAPFAGRTVTWASIGLAWASGLLGVHLLPLARVTRALVSVAYTPAAAGIIFLGLLSAACGWYGACP